MNNLTGFETQDNCNKCQWSSTNFFCGLPSAVISEFNSLKLTRGYARGTLLFAQGETAEGVYVMCSGRVKLSTYSKDGKAIIVRVAQAGEILGLSASISGIVHEATAQVVDHCQVNFVKRDAFLLFLRNHIEVALNALKELSRNYHKAHMQICSLGLSATVKVKLAKLFLDWHDLSTNGDGHISMTYTHEELAEMIGTSRETVTRLINDFRKQNMVALVDAELRVLDRRKLEALLGSVSAPILTRTTR